MAAKKKSAKKVDDKKPAAKKVAAKKTRPRKAAPLSRAQVQAMLGGVTARRVEQLQTRDDRPLPFSKVGRTCRYDPLAVAEWLAEEAVVDRLASSDEGEIDLKVERAKNLHLQNQQLEIRVQREAIGLEQDQGTYGPLDLMVEVLSSVAGEISPIVESLPGELQKSLDVKPAVVLFVTEKTNQMMNSIHDLAEGRLERFLIEHDDD